MKTLVILLYFLFCFSYFGLFLKNNKAVDLVQFGMEACC